MCSFHSQFGWFAPFLLGASLCQSARAQTLVLANGFEADSMGTVPLGWRGSKGAAFRAFVSDSAPLQGRQALVLEHAGGARMEGVDYRIAAAGMRGQEVHLHVFIRASLEDSSAWGVLWLRVDRPNGKSGFYDNRSITSSAWHHHELVGDVPADADTLVFGVALQGAARLVL